MLILTRKVGEAIAIDEQVTVRVLDIKGGQVKLGVEAPSHITVHREEVFARIMEVNRQAAEVPTDVEHVARLIEGAAGSGEGKKGE